MVLFFRQTEPASRASCCLTAVRKHPAATAATSAGLAPIVWSMQAPVSQDVHASAYTRMHWSALCACVKSSGLLIVWFVQLSADGVRIGGRNASVPRPESLPPTTQEMACLRVGGAELGGWTAGRETRDHSCGRATPDRRCVVAFACTLCLPRRCSYLRGWHCAVVHASCSRGAQDGPPTSSGLP